MKARIFFTIILLMILGTVAQISHGSKSALIYPGGKIVMSDDPVAVRQVSRETLNGNEYIKINLGELYDICANQESEKLEKRFVMRGFVYREGKLDPLKQFGIVRLAVVCCAPHATPVGLRVEYDNFNELKKGEWIKLYGKVKKANPNPASQKAPAHRYPAEKEYVIIPDEIIKIARPKYPYMTRWNDSEPYMY